MNCPKVRFSSYNDDWKEVNLKDAFTYFSTNSFSRDQLSNYGTIKNIHYGDIHRKFSNIVNVQRDVDTYIKDTNFINKYDICKDGDLIFADASEDYEGIGKAIELFNVDCDTISGLHTIMVRDTNNIFAPKFKGYYFNSPVIHNQIRIMANGFKVYGISKDSISRIIAKIPSYEEQIKISNTLELLDKKITLQTNKVSNLKLYKKAITKKIMNSIKEEKKIRDICIYENGNSYENAVNVNGNYNLISLNSIDIDGNLKNSMKKVLLDNPNTLFKNDIVMVLSDVGHGDFLGISTLIPSDDMYVLNQRMGLLRIYDDSCPGFVVNAINAVQKKFKILGQGSSQLNLAKEDILNVKIKYPDKSFQKKCEIIFESLNKEIYLNEQRLKKLEQLKKGLMQNMFV